MIRTLKEILLAIFSPDPPEEIEKDKEIDYETKTWSNPRYNKNKEEKGGNEK